LVKKNVDHNIATNGPDEPLDTKSKLDTCQTQVKQKVQMYLSTDNGLNTGDLVSEKQKSHINIIQLNVIF